MRTLVDGRPVDHGRGPMRTDRELDLARLAAARSGATEDEDDIAAANDQRLAGEELDGHRELTTGGPLDLRLSHAADLRSGTCERPRCLNADVPSNTAAGVRPLPSPPGLGNEQMRRAYLDLLRLALCDLVAPETETVATHARGPVSRPLADEELSMRVEGREWPLRGLTMIGYDRLGDLQACIEAVVAERVPGDVIEAGVWRGGASMFARATLDSLGEADRTVWIADSFRGLPPPDEQGFPEDEGIVFHHDAYLSVPQEVVRAGFQRLGLDHDLEFVEGFFSETLPALAGQRWSVIRLDGDMYESTWVTLESLYPGLSKGGFVIVDDYGAVPPCKAAVEDFRAKHGITAPLERVDWTCVRWQREDEPAGGDEPQRSRRRETPSPAGTPSPTQVLSHRELGLMERVEELERSLSERRGWRWPRR
jgi:O-methyltransferase